MTDKEAVVAHESSQRLRYELVKAGDKRVNRLAEVARGGAAGPGACSPLPLPVRLSHSTTMSAPSSPDAPSLEQATSNLRMPTPNDPAALALASAAPRTFYSARRLASRATSARPSLAQPQQASSVLLATSVFAPRACSCMVGHADTGTVDTLCARATPCAMTWDDMDVVRAGCVILSLLYCHLLTLRAYHRPRSLRAAPPSCSPPSRGASRSRRHRSDHERARLSSLVARHSPCPSTLPNTLNSCLSSAPHAPASRTALAGSRGSVWPPDCTSSYTTRSARRLASCAASARATHDAPYIFV
jgi:hypothetical protein